MKVSKGSKCRIEHRYKDGKLVRLGVRGRSADGEYHDVDGEALKAYLPEIIDAEKALKILHKHVSQSCSLAEVVQKVNKPRRSTRQPQKPAIESATEDRE